MRLLAEISPKRLKEVVEVFHALMLDATEDEVGHAKTAAALLCVKSHAQGDGMLYCNMPVLMPVSCVGSSIAPRNRI